MSSQTEQWGSNFGFLMAAIGSAIGLGSIWRFPYLVGSNGGGAFILMYILITIVVGILSLSVEIAIGRHGGSDAVESYKAIRPASAIFSYLSVITGFLIMTFYSVIGGWIIHYLYKAILLDFGNIPEGYFAEFTASPSSVIWQLLFIGITIFIVMRGVAEGIEKYSKWMNILLFIMIIATVIQSLTLPGASGGVEFLLKPDFSIFSSPKVWLTATGQALFSLSIGMAIMVTYGCYLPKSVNILRSSAIVAVATIFIALLMGFAIFPALFAMGQNPAQGPGLLFIVLPKVFSQMPAGGLFAILFFFAIFFASITSSISLMEPIIARLMRMSGWSRTKAAIITTAALLLISTPVALSLGLFSQFTINNLNLFDMMDFITDKILMPINTLFALILAGWLWKSKGFLHEISNNGALKIPFANVILWLVRILLPLVLIIIIASYFIKH